MKGTAICLCPLGRESPRDGEANEAGPAIATGRWPLSSTRDTNGPSRSKRRAFLGDLSAQGLRNSGYSSGGSRACNAGSGAPGVDQ